MKLHPVSKSLTAFGVLPVALISLPEDKARRTTLLTRGIPSDWLDNYWPGVDLRMAGPESLQRLADSKQISALIKRKVSAGEIGCAAAHRSVAAWLARSEYDMALVLEDDVIPLRETFTEEISAIAKAFAEHARAGAAFICHLGPPESQMIDLIKRRIVSSRNKVLSDKLGLYLHADPFRKIWRAHAYLLSKGAAKRQLLMEPRIMTLADDWSARRNLNLIDELFFVYPSIIKQDENVQTTIGSRTSEEFVSPELSGTDFTTRIKQAVREAKFWQRAAASCRYRALHMKARLISLLPYRLSGTKWPQI